MGLYSLFKVRYRIKLPLALCGVGLFSVFVLSNTNIYAIQFNLPLHMTKGNLNQSSKEQPVVFRSQAQYDALQKQLRRQMEKLRHEYRNETAQRNILDIKPIIFSQEFKNPCWVESKTILKCLPYFYLVGAPKSGTTDLNRRLVEHPQISSNVVKEPHWLPRRQFKYDRISGRTIAQPLNNYLSVFNRATKDIYLSVDSDGYHRKVVGDCSASTLWDNLYWGWLYPDSNMTEPLYTNPDYIHHLNPKVKIIAILRNPIDRAYSGYLYFTYGSKSPKMFDDYVRTSIEYYNTCLLTYSLRACAYSRSVLALPIRLHIGLYHLHLKEWFRVFPRDQIMVINLNSFTANTSLHMEKIFSFLDLDEIQDPAPSSSLKNLADPNIHANSRRKTDVKVGPMWNSTRKLLFDFYKEHNEELVKLLGKEFDFNEGEGNT